MTFRLYIVPIIGNGSKTNPRKPKHFSDLSAAWSAMDYGFEPVMFVGADLSASDNSFVTSQADVSALPFDLSPLLTSNQAQATRDVLEDLHIPAQWVNTTLTWLEVVRTVLGMFSYIQRFGAVYAENTGNIPPSIFSGGITLNTTFGSLPAAVQTAMIQTAEEFGIPTTGLSASTTLRVILKSMADFFEDQVYNFNGTLL